MAFELTPFGTFRELRTIRDEMDSIWNRFFGGWSGLEPYRGEWAPSLDVSETKDSIVVRAEVPGMDAKDVNITLNDGLMTIKGEKKVEKEEKVGDKETGETRKSGAS